MSYFEEVVTEIEILPNSPYARITLDNNDLVINILDGIVLYNSKEAKARIITTNFIIEDNAILMLTADETAFNFLYLSPSEKKVKWITEVGTQEKMSMFKSLFVGANETEDKILKVNNDLYVTVKGFLFHLKIDSGEITWKTDYKINSFILSQNLQNIITITNTTSLLSTKTTLNILNTSNGEKLWKNDVSTKFLSYPEDWNDRILIAHNSGFNFYSYTDGKKMWKKDTKGKSIKRVIPVDNNYLYIADTEMNLVNQEGVAQWKKFIEIADNSEDEIYFLDKIDNNRLLYLTDTYGNMVDYTSGKKIWKRNIKFSKKRPIAVGHNEKDNVFLAYNHRKIYKFDPNSNDAPEPIGDKIDVQNDKTISSLEVINGSIICIVGQNDVIGVAPDGNVIYHNTYKEPGEAGRRLLKTAAITAKTFGNISNAKHNMVANSSYSVSYRDNNGRVVESKDYVFSEQDRAKAQKNMDAQQSVMNDIDSELMPKVKHRFNALKQTAEYAYVFARGTEGETTQLVKVRKADGKEVDKISISNNKPLYEIDPATGSIYYVCNNELRTFTAK
ncbi:PQQ-binding-like beta-propeller repeat protein [Myroides sp. M-43]|uniref:outer membrane protein assembly factor BamB family protein n=1 Tax=Myroides oncorhynchi TaxID=2893756 RepID=UPI001E6490BA|nr:PQQ-binding-like beta-propeller repeat protein [Myroides oncorhynchi]MCC9041393.1 PQQ-binding-like beta-propeller repeat protein [Myroides oncorhynchi]